MADIQEVIEQFQSLERHCREMIYPNELDRIWKADRDALGVTIKILESVQEMQDGQKWVINREFLCGTGRESFIYTFSEILYIKWLIISKKP